MHIRVFLMYGNKQIHEVKRNPIFGCKLAQSLHESPLLELAWSGQMAWLGLGFGLGGPST